jgi:hypothetical protein
MTTPTTPTGKRLWNNPDIVADLAGGPTRYDILAIEQEARAMERARLREEAKTMWAESAGAGWHYQAWMDEDVLPSIDSLLADPDHDR